MLAHASDACAAQLSAFIISPRETTYPVVSPYLLNQHDFPLEGECVSP